MDQEPSVLDYIKSKLMPWKNENIQIPLTEGESEEIVSSEPVQRKDLAIPWRVLLSLALGLAAQISLEPRTDRSWLPGVVLYLFAFLSLLWGVYRREIVFPAGYYDHDDPIIEGEVERVELGRYIYIGAAFLLCIITFWLMGNRKTGNYQFNPLNLLFWLGALIVMILGLNPQAEGHKNGMVKLFEKIKHGSWSLRFSWWQVLFLVVLGIGVFFRFYHLNSVPPEMVSDHAEKLLDIQDVMDGETHTFFPRNTGREFFQFYWTALIVLLFGQGVSFFSLKLGTVILGALTLPFIYLIGKELGNKRAGLLAMGFAGVATWPNIISRIGLRFALYPFFYAPTLYFFLRGMRRMRRSDFVWAGVFLGLGLNGYSPFRIVPILLVLGFLLFLLHKPAETMKKKAWVGLIIIVLISGVVFLPLLRYAVDNPEMVGYRALTRLGSVEQPLPGSPVGIFFNNLWRATTMFFWDDGDVWVHSVPHRPALDIISGALFFLGFVLVVLRYLKQKHWTDLFMLLSIFVLMLPSILSLAFPAENPCLNRTAGAMIPVFVLIGYGLDRIMGSVEEIGRSGKRAAWILAGGLFLFSALQNYNLVFVQYKLNYDLSSWNTSDMGRVAGGFADSVGSIDTAYVVGYPHWADTRVVGIVAGYVRNDLAIWPEQFEATLADPRAKLFMINPNDVTDLQTLQRLYPEGVLYNYDVPIEGKDFLMLFVPASGNASP